MSDCIQKLPYLSVTEFDFFHMVQMKSFHKRKSRLEVQRNNLGKESYLWVYPFTSVSFSIQSPLHSMKVRNQNSTSSSAAINTPELFSWYRLLLTYKGWWQCTHVTSRKPSVIYRPSSNTTVHVYPTNYCPSHIITQSTIIINNKILKCTLSLKRKIVSRYQWITINLHALFQFQGLYQHLICSLAL